MSFETLPFTPRSGLLPSRAAAVHTLPAASRPGRRSMGPVPDLPTRTSVIAVVPVHRVNDHARVGLSTALSMSASRVVAVHVCGTPESVNEFTEAWERWEPGVPLVLLQRLPSDGDSVADSIADYLRRRHTAYPALVVVTEAAPAGPQPGPTRGDALEAALLSLTHVVVCRQRATAGPNTAGVRR